MNRQSKERKPLSQGQRFGRLTVIELDHIKEYIDKKNIVRYRKYYKCICDCGNFCVTEKSQLTTGHCQSCGCLQKEANRTKLNCHGMSKTKIYSIWSTMKDRCFREKCIDYKNYGGRGITIQKEWLDFKNFYEWAKNNGYKEGLTIERIDVNGNYCPENCKWIPMSEQYKNKQTPYQIRRKQPLPSEQKEEMNA
jgi:hypothetical protein